jgi:hypothetical protein
MCPTSGILRTSTTTQEVVSVNMLFAETHGNRPLNMKREISRKPLPASVEAAAGKPVGTSRKMPIRTSALKYHAGPCAISGTHSREPVSVEKKARPESALSSGWLERARQLKNEKVMEPKRFIRARPRQNLTTDPFDSTREDQPKPQPKKRCNGKPTHRSSLQIVKRQPKIPKCKCR